MSIKSMLLTTHEVQAILSGRQTQLRRVIMPANRTKAKRMGGYRQGDGLWIGGYERHEKVNSHTHIKDYSVSACWWRLDCYTRRFAPCKPGDILWGRETWACLWDLSGDEEYAYRADYHGITTYDDANGEPIIWKPSSNMPREAARLFLNVTDVRVERLQNISYDNGDIWAQGIPAMHDRQSETNAFVEQWDARNAKQGYGWDTNPWVWVYTFERTDRPENWPEGR